MEGHRPIEYPKWVDGVLIQNAGQEQALRAALADAVSATHPVEGIPPTSPAGLRMRRTRERRREGKRTIRCDISSAQIEALAEAGFIDPVMRDDAAEVARGVSRVMDRLTRSGRGESL